MLIRLYSPTSGANRRHIMWIRNNNPATRRLYGEWMQEYVDDVVEDLPGDKRGVVFDGAVQVKSEVGEELIERYDTVEVNESD